MDFQIIAWIVGTGITVLSVLMLLVQYHSKQTNVFMTSKYSVLEKQNEKREEEVKGLRSELTKEYVRNDQFNSTVENFRSDINKIFDQNTQLSNGLFQLIGRLENNGDNNAKS